MIRDCGKRLMPFIVSAFAAAVSDAAISPAGTNDMTQAIADAISACKSGGKVELKEGEYHFYAEHAREMDFFISNHDQPRPRRVQLAIDGARDFSLVGLGKGAKFIFHGVSTGILVIDSSWVRLENLQFDWAVPPIGEARISGFKADGSPELDFRVHGCNGLGNARMLWDGDTHAIKPGTGDVFEMSQAEVGDTISFRTWTRPAPAICLYRADGVEFKDVVIHSAHGMGLLAQRSSDIAWRGGGVYPREGCFCSTTADATHFSNCKGLVSVTGARFEGMMDDAINIHATCLRIEGKPDSKRIRCRYVHDQAYGFEVFAPGETLRFIRARTLENGPEAKVSSVEMEDERTVVIALDREIADYGVGDAVENADWQPEVEFNGNVVRNNRARAALFTTSRRVVARDNTFDHVSGSAILFAGDASNWYESGACTDVEISGNRFLDCLTSPYQFCNAVITVSPSVPDLKAQKTPYHRNIRIFGNEFNCPGAKLWDAISVDDVEWRDNRIIPAEVWYIPGWNRTTERDGLAYTSCTNVFKDAKCRFWQWDGDHRWSTSVRNADAAAKRLADEIAATDGGFRSQLVIVGHSLGGRIVARTLADLSRRGITIAQGIMLAPAISMDDTDLPVMGRGCERPAIVVVNPKDVVLKYGFDVAGGEGSSAFGMNGSIGALPNVVEYSVPKSITSDTKIDALWGKSETVKRICNHLAAFYFTELARILDGSPSADAQVRVPQGKVNLEWKVIDAGVWWDIIDKCGGWKLERNIVTHHFRIVSPDRRRAAWGSEADMRRSFEKIRRQSERMLPR